MTGIKSINSVYFIGIGGIGMSALARYFRSLGKNVAGYDKTETPLTKQLMLEGIAVHYEDNLKLAPKDVDLVVYTPAIPDDHKEFQYYRQNGYNLHKRSEVLGAITAGCFTIAVAGTHGKTTITTLIAHILRHSGYGCNAFLGGIAVNYNSNYWSDARKVCVVEADEYDRSFLQLNPDIAVITAMDPDHLDIYGTVEAMEHAFIEFATRIKPGGSLVKKLGLSQLNDVSTERKMTYSLDDEDASVYAKNIKINDGGYVFDVSVKSETVHDVGLQIGGLHNVENTVAAIGVARELDIDAEKIRAAVSAFRGVKRRFEYILNTPGRVYVDDYAHHPAELQALISGARSLFSDLRCTVVFQPHLYSRTRDLADGFAAALDLADEVILLPIYPARELPIAGVASEMIRDRMHVAKRTIMNKDELLKWVQSTWVKSGGLLITAGAGDIDTLVEPIRQILTNK